MPFASVDTQALFNNTLAFPQTTQSLEVPPVHD
jgi:hypothetical protein